MKKILFSLLLFSSSVALSQFFSGDFISGDSASESEQEDLSSDGAIKKYQNEDVHYCGEKFNAHHLDVDCDRQGNPITGTLELRNMYGKIYRETHYKNGRKDGLEREYDPESGRLIEEINYKEGKLDGIRTGYDKNGKLTWKSTYKDGFRESSIEYFDDGSIESITNNKSILLNGHSVSVSHGPQKYYYRNGKPRLELNYEDGIYDGSQKYYSENGNLTKEEVYVNHVHELTRTYDSEGYLKEESNPGGRFMKKYQNGELVEGMIHIDNPTQQQCDSKADFNIGLGSIIENQESLEGDYDALLHSGLQKICPNRYYILRHSEFGSWIISTLNEPGTLRVNQGGEKEVYAPSYSCVNHICANEDICATPQWEAYTGHGKPKKYHYKIGGFTHSCFW